MPWTDALLTIVRVGVAVLVLAAVVRLFRITRRESRVAGILLATGILVRAFLGVALFWISFLELPLARSRQMGEGFWRLAPDALVYFHAAAVAGGTLQIPQHVPSPTFVMTLAAWMQLVGATPPAALLLNIFCLSSVAALVSRYLRGQPLAATVLVGAISFSPALVIFGSQPLKDTFFVSLIVLACVGVSLALRLVGNEDMGGWRRWGFVVGAGIVAPFGLMAGVRPYYPIFLEFAMAAGLLVVILRFRGRALGRRLLAGAAILLCAGLAWGVGLGPRYFGYAKPIAAHLGLTRWGGSGKSWVDHPVATLDSVRRGYTNSGGNTNFGRGRGQSRLDAVGAGLAALAVPCTVLRSFGLITIGGNRGLLAAVDLDTLFFDGSVVAVCWLLWRRRRSVVLDVPYLVFGGALVVLVTVSLAYVVTNFGTLFRLRLILAAAWWTLPLALAGRDDVGRNRPDWVA